MDTTKDNKDMMLYHAYRCMYFNEMLIRQCDSWLTAEEGNTNLMQKIKSSKIAAGNHNGRSAGKISFKFQVSSWAKPEN